ncbi:uncharacterized protein LOC122262689 [Penaeus japonicus]|uniref:uncharacterized protein LOC122262689 n=1 Tax=Penaeus japonicus TaxID=27405 RepID=UPI001C716EB9|nr:uncharacterized protein LOC122262689 [Penaeus japonicus]
MVCPCCVWYGHHGPSWLCVVWSPWSIPVVCGMVIMVRPGCVVWFNMVPPGCVWYGSTWSLLVVYGHHGLSLLCVVWSPWSLLVVCGMVTMVPPGCVWYGHHGPSWLCGMVTMVCPCCVG